MDDFLSDIYTILFAKWILLQEVPDFETKVNDDYTEIHFFNKHADIEIVFNTMNIIEFKATNTQSGEIEYYLHFQMKTLNHAMKLFRELTHYMKHIGESPTIKILLCCSGGLTTSYFAMKMNEASKLMSLPYVTEASGYNNLYYVAQDYDVVLLAPQISYLHAKAREILKDKIVLNVPPEVFAKYDVKAIFTLVKDSLEIKKNQSDQRIPLPVMLDVEIRHKTLALSIFRNKQSIHVAYRVYDKNQEILLDNEVIKPTVNLQDICDVIDIARLHYPRIRYIGIATPGIIDDGYVTSTSLEGWEKPERLGDVLTERYHLPICICNEVNAAAVGYYSSQDQVSSLAFLFQPVHALSGAGIIVDNCLLHGMHNLVGEVQFLPLDLTEDKKTLSMSPEGCIEVVSRTLVSIISLLSPEELVLYCDFIPHVLPLYEEMATLIPKKYIPPITKVDNMQEYILLGAMILSTTQNYESSM